MAVVVGIVEWGWRWCHMVVVVGIVKWGWLLSSRGGGGCMVLGIDEWWWLFVVECKRTK